MCSSRLSRARSSLARAVAAALLSGALAAPSSPAWATAASTTSASAGAAQPKAGCLLGTPSAAVQHVVYLQFDNVHFTRDNPNVPSDLEQMPHLLDFFTSQGTLLTQQHTPLIAHTGTNFVTSLTGVYPDRHGANVSNGLRYFNADGSSSPSTMFGYWTSHMLQVPPNPPDPSLVMLDAEGHNAPAPWVPYTRAGCDVGFVGMANTVLENTSSDVTAIFGAGSPQAQAAAANAAQATADLVGVAVHCAAGDVVCSPASGGIPDRLPQEPGGYVGFDGLFGHAAVAPAISPDGPLLDLNGEVIQDAKGNVGFPGFDALSPAVSLSYVAALQEHGVPITFAYIADAHDSHTGAGAYGPGQAEYVAALREYDQAFATFFARLAADGITPQNTLFVVSADEGDHFVGGPPSPATCDGVTTPCTYPHLGELSTNLTGLLATQAGVTTSFAVHADTAPTIYIKGNPPRQSPLVRAFGHALLGLDVPNLLSNQTEKLALYLADAVEMKLLHMVTADPARTPTLVLFAKPDYYLTTGDPTCPSPPGGCIKMDPSAAWNHGAVSGEMNTTFLGLVGPSVEALGVKDDVLSDHADTRPTMLAALGLRDDYSPEGRVLAEVLAPRSLGLDDPAAFVRLAAAYKQIDAPLGALGLDSLAASTAALGGSDAAYAAGEDRLASITARRDALAGRMRSMLESAEFDGQGIDAAEADGLVEQAQALLEEVHALATAARA